MHVNWIPTNEYYHRMMDAPNLETRQQLFRELFIQPWKPMMEMIGPMFHADPSDDFAVARAWHWLLPEDLDTIPAALSRLEAADAWKIGGEALKEGAAHFAAYSDQIGMDSVEGWLVVADPLRSDPIGRGYTGAVDWTAPRLVGQFDTPNDYNLPRLPGLIVHEFHHLVRLRLFPWGMQTSVADYIIHEGLAESFAAALFGQDVVGYYATDISEPHLETARRLIGAGLDKAGFDVIRAYIFGDTLAQKFGLEKVGMPDYGGYAVGYRVVQAFLERTGTSIEEATFLPAQTIIAQSDYFG